jgi:hypothetical protein
MHVSFELNLLLIEKTYFDRETKEKLPNYLVLTHKAVGI